MTTVDKDKKSAADKAVELKPPTNGPRSSRARKAINKEKAKTDPAYVVTVKAKEPAIDADGNEIKEKAFYRPEEIRAKARSMLHSGKLTSQEKQVLEEILGPPEKAKAPKIS